MRNLVYIPFAFDPLKQTGVNVSKNNTLHVYLKNICVATASIRKYNPTIDIAVICNIELPNFYKKILLEQKVLIIIEDFDSFVFPNDYKWNLAFYKLCALEKVVQKYKYDNYIYIDVDVIIQNSLDSIFKELSDNILMYDINHGLNVRDYQIIVREFNDFGISSYITHYGGEFFGASYKNAKKFILECKDIYNKMIADNFITTKGDEFIISIAAYRCKDIVKNAGAYIYRFWTGAFYLVSTCYKFNAVSILHLPSGKNTSIIKIFERYVKKNKFPHKEKVHRICHLNKPSLKVKIKNLIKKILHKK